MSLSTNARLAGQQRKHKEKPVEQKIQHGTMVSKGRRRLKSFDLAAHIWNGS